MLMVIKQNPYLDMRMPFLNNYRYCADLPFFFPDPDDIFFTT